MSQNGKQSPDKLTPLHDVTWYIKWISTACILLAITTRSVPELVLVDLVLSTIGCMGWGYVGYKWHDRALLTINVAAVTILLGGVVKVLFS